MIPFVLLCFEFVNMFSLLDWESDTSMTINYDLYDIHNTVVLMTS